MENVKERLSAAIAAQLTGAPDTPAKAELIEELSENLFARYTDMTTSGMDEAAAYQSALDDLGDTAELVDYLNSLEPDQPLPGPEPEAGPESGDLDGLLRDVGDIIRDAVKAAQAAVSAVDVDGIVRDAMETAKGTVRQAQDAARDIRDSVKRDGYTYTSPDGQVHITVNPGRPPKSPKPPKAPVPPAPPAPPQPQGPDAPPPPPPPEEDGPGGPLFHGKGAWMEHLPGGDYAFQSFGAPLTAIDVEVGGDITVRADDTPEGDVVIGGDVDDLDVRAENGVLIIRQGGTASRGFFLRRGMRLADVELTLPRRPWEAIRLTSTASGDIDVDLKEPVNTLEVRTVSGEAGVKLARCGRLSINTVSGDIGLTVGQADTVEISTVSGDMELDGDFSSLCLSSTSGDLWARSGIPCAVQCASVSGDVELELEALPPALEVSTRSGDAEISIPDGGPFGLDFTTASGECTSDFFSGVLSGRHSAFQYRGGSEAGGPVYHIRTASGDCELNRL